MKKPKITSKTLFVVSLRGTSHGYGVTAKAAYKDWEKRRAAAKAQKELRDSFLLEEKAANNLRLEVSKLSKERSGIIGELDTLVCKFTDLQALHKRTKEISQELRNDIHESKRIEHERVTRLVTENTKAQLLELQTAKQEADASIVKSSQTISLAESIETLFCCMVAMNSFDVDQVVQQLAHLGKYLAETDVDAAKQAIKQGSSTYFKWIYDSQNK